jgi:hypothetical protein
LLASLPRKSLPFDPPDLSRAKKKKRLAARPPRKTTAAIHVMIITVNPAHRRRDQRGGVWVQRTMGRSFSN